MFVDDMLDMLVDRREQKVSIYSFSEDCNVYEGKGDDVPYEHLYEEVSSIEVYNNLFTLNID